MMEQMQVPQIAPEAEAYADQVAQEQYDLAQWMGMPESQAEAQGQYAYEAIEMQLEDEAEYEAAASQQGYQRFMENMAANEASRKQDQIKRQTELKLQEERETARLSNEHMKRMIA